MSLIRLLMFVMGMLSGKPFNFLFLGGGRGGGGEGEGEGRGRGRGVRRFGQCKIFPTLINKSGNF